MHTSYVLASPWRLLIILLICALALSGVGTLRAKNPAQKLQFKFLGREQGLHAGTVYCVLQDRQGFIWVGTRFGLKRYDGYEFKSYDLQSDSSNVLSGPITSMCEDSSGMLWLVVKGGGITSFDRRDNRITNYRNDPQDRSSLSPGHFIALHVDGSRRLWAVNQTWEMNLYDPIHDRFIRHEPPAGIVSEKSGKGIQLLGHNEGSVILSLQDELSFNFNDRSYESRAVTSSTYGSLKIICRLHTTSWLASPIVSLSGKPNLFEVDARSRRILRETAITGAIFHLGSIRTMDSSVLLLSSVGLYCLDAETFTSVLVPLSPGLLHPACIYLDRSDRIWIGGAGGIYVCEGQNTKFSAHLLPNRNELGTNTSNAAVRAIHAIGSTMEAGDQLGHIYRWDPAQRLFHDVDRLQKTSGDQVPYSLHQIASDHQARWLYATNSGPLFVGEVNGSRMNLPVLRNANGYAVCEDANNAIWIGTSALDNDSSLFGNSLLRYDPVTKTLRSYRLSVPWPLMASASYVFNIFEDRHQQLWIGSSVGLFKYDRIRDTCIPMLHPRCDGSGHVSNNIWVIFEDSRDDLWLGSWGRGLHRFDRATNTYTDFTTEQGLPNNNIQSILEDEKGFLWIGTSKGLSRFDPRTNTFTNFGIGDGLIDEEFQPKAATKLPSGEMFFGAIAGITSFFPSQISSRERDAPIALTSMHISGKEMGHLLSGETIYLDHDSSDLVFEYAALSFGSNDRTRYEYMLVGLDDDWIHAGNRRTASYNNVPPGEYLLRIRSFDGSNAKADSELQLNVIVAPPYWETWWFRLVVGLAVASTAGIVTIRGMRRQQDEHLRLERAREKERMDLAGDIHDGPLQDLYATRFMLGDENSELAQLLINVRGDLRSISSVLQPPKLQFGLVEELEILVQAFRQRCPDTDFALISSGSQPRLPESVGRNIFRIVRTALTNVQKHSKASTCELNASFENNSVLVTIKDDGVGFDPKSLNTVGREHFGLFLMKCYAKEIKATIRVDASEGAGTAVHIRWSGKRFGLNKMRRLRNDREPHTI